MTRCISLGIHLNTIQCIGMTTNDMRLTMTVNTRSPIGLFYETHHDFLRATKL